MLRCGASLAVSLLRVHEGGEELCFLPIERLLYRNVEPSPDGSQVLFRLYFATRVLPDAPTSVLDRQCVIILCGPHRHFPGIYIRAQLHFPNAFLRFI